MSLGVNTATLRSEAGDMRSTASAVTAPEAPNVSSVVTGGLSSAIDMLGTAETLLGDSLNDGLEQLAGRVDEIADAAEGADG